MGNFSTKMVSLVSVATLAATTMGASLVSAASEFLPYAETLASNDVISAQSTEAGYRLGDTVTRAELAKVTANLGGYMATDCAGNVYGDVTSSLGDLCGYIEALADAGVVSTANANFRPAAPVTRAEMVKMLLGAVGETGSDVDAGYTDVAGLGDLAGFINRANELGCAATSTYFRPNATASRGEAFKIAACIAYPDDTTTPPVDNTGSTNTGVTAGTVTVSLAEAAVAQYVPMNASSVKVGTIKLTAGANGATVSSVVITRSGLGDVNGIDSLQLAQGGVPASDTRTMSTSSQTSTLKFTTPVVLAAGASASYDVLVSLKGSFPNNQHQFAVTTVNVVNGSAAGLPVTLGLLNTTSYSVGNVTVNPLSLGSVVSGKTAQTAVTVSILANKDATLNGFTLTKSSGEDWTKVLANVKAYYNGAVVGTVTMTSDKITVTGLNIARLNGESANIDIKGDGIYVGTATAQVFGVASTADVSATEKATGYAMGVVTPLPAYVSLSLNQVDLTMTKVSTGSKTVAQGSSSVELLNINLTSDATFDISEYGITLTGSADLRNFVDDKVTIYVAGNDTELTYASGSTGLSTGSGKVFSATSDAFRVEPGTTVNVRIVGNVKSTATVPADYTFNLTLYKAKNVSNGQTVALAGKTLNGDKTTVNVGSYTVQKPSTIPSNKTVGEGTVSDVLYFEMRASAEDQTLTGVTITSSGAFDTYATRVALMQGTTELAAITNSTDLAGTGYAFTNLSQRLNKDVTVPFTVRVTLKSGDVLTLGKNVMVSLSKVGVGRSVDQSKATTTTSTLPLAGNVYQIAANTPVVALTAQDLKNTTVQFSNASSYDIVIESVKAEITRNSVNGTYVLWSGYAQMLDQVNGSVVSNTGTVPGSVTFTLSSPLTVGAGPITRVIELVDPANTVTDADYTVTVKEVNFHYVDRTDSLKVSPSIKETYTVAK